MGWRERGSWPGKSVVSRRFVWSHTDLCGLTPQHLWGWLRSLVSMIWAWAETGATCLSIQPSFPTPGMLV